MTSQLYIQWQGGKVRKRLVKELESSNLVMWSGKEAL